METPSEVGGPNPINKASSQAVIHNLDMINALYEIVNSTTNPRIMLDSVLLRLSSNLGIDAAAIEFVPQGVVRNICGWISTAGS